MKIKKYKNINETLYVFKLDSGLEVNFIPKKGFESKMAILATKFGSFNSVSTIKVDGKTIKIPEGIAHFLEHRMFTIKDVDATQYFSDLGAYSNAFTTYDKTAYYFDTNKNFYENLKVLITMLSSFDSSEEQVENEKQIIIEELNMYKDDPFSKLNNTLFLNSYHTHPIRNDIGGTNESVQSTTKKMLEECFNIYYHPSNLCLVVVGDLDINELKSFLLKNQWQTNTNKKPKQLSFKDEPFSVVKEKQIIKGNVSIPILAMLFKLKPFSKKQDIQKECLKFEILLSYLFDPSGVYTDRWLQEKIISNAIDYYHCSNIDLNHLILYNVSDKYDLVIDKINEVFDKNHWNMTQDDFDRIKNKMIGLNLKNYGSVNTVAKEFIGFKLEGLEYFKEIDKLKEITIHDVKDAYLQLCDAPRAVVVERSE